MKVKLLGAAQAVTGSCYIVTTHSSKFTIDCGMHQGSSSFDKRNANIKEYEPSTIDFVLLTHAHIDHSGLLPKIVKEGFTGPIYCTAPTKALLELMLLDSAHIQEMEAEWASRKSIRQGGNPIEPLYTTDDAINCNKLLKVIDYNKPFEPASGLTVCYRDAGHILGSSFLEVVATEPEGTTSVIFSGDLGRPNALLVQDPSVPKLKADYIFMESTYGDRNHKNESKSRDELLDAVLKSYAAGQKTIIPAFAVERTQEIVFMLYTLHKEGLLPKDLPIYVDSPLAVKATQVFRNFSQYLDEQVTDFIDKGEAPFSLPGLVYVADANASKAINEKDGPGVVISASGMCNAGRIKHHLRHNLFKEGAHIVFTGYQAVGTPGRKIVDGAKSISILGDIIPINAQIDTIGGFSGHAGQSQILDWLRSFCHKDLQVILTHGEKHAQEVLSGLILDEFNITTTSPSYLEEVTLTPGGHPVIITEPAPGAIPARIDMGVFLTDMEGKIAGIRAKIAEHPQKSWAEQVDLRNQLQDLNTKLLYILSEL